MIGIGSGQLRNVIGDFASDVGLLLPVQVIDFRHKIAEFWQDEFASERPVLDDVFEGVVVELDLLQIMRVLNLHDILHGLPQSRVVLPQTRSSDRFRQSFDRHRLSIVAKAVEEGLGGTRGDEAGGRNGTRCLFRTESGGRRRVKRAEEGEGGF